MSKVPFVNPERPNCSRSCAEVNYAVTDYQPNLIVVYDVGGTSIRRSIGEDIMVMMNR